MLISLNYKFIFVANIKTASNSIEKVLSPYSDICLTETRFEKHATLAEIERRFSWLFGLIKREEFFIFSVIRDPVDLVVSLYSSHTAPQFAGDPGLYTGELQFSEFRSSWAARNAEQLRPQAYRFLNQQGELDLDYIISYRNLIDGFRVIGERLGILTDLEEQVNVSPKCIARADLRDDDLDWIENHFFLDRAILETLCDRPLTLEDRKCATDRFKFLKGTSTRLVPSDPYGISGGWEELIDALYHVLLLRDPDEFGPQSILTSLRDGLDFESLIRGFVTSGEFARVHQTFIKTYVRVPN